MTVTPLHTPRNADDTTNEQKWFRQDWRRDMPYLKHSQCTRCNRPQGDTIHITIHNNNCLCAEVVNLSTLPYLSSHVYTTQRNINSNKSLCIPTFLSSIIMQANIKSSLNNDGVFMYSRRLIKLMYARIRPTKPTNMRYRCISLFTL